MKSCINCNKALSESDNFCPECGQSTNNKLTLNVLFSDLIGNYLSFDARFFRTIIPLLFKPGYVAKAFINGKRNTFLHPGKMYLFISVIFFFLLSLKTNSFRSEINEDIYEEFSNNIHVTDSLVTDSLLLDSTQTSPPIYTDSIALDTINHTNSNDLTPVDSLFLQKSQLYKSENFLVRQIGKILDKKGQNIFDLFFNMISVAIFLLVPVYAFFLKLLFYKSHNYTQNLIFSLYLFTFAFILSIIYLGLYNYDNQYYIIYTIGLLFLTYLVLAFKNFYNQKLTKAIIKASIQSSIFTIFLLPVTFIILVLASIYFY